MKTTTKHKKSTSSNYKVTGFVEKIFQSHTLWISFLVVISLCSFHDTFAYDFEYDDIFYKFDNNHKTVCVTYIQKDYGSYSGQVIIPPSVLYKGISYKVTKIDDYAFSYSRNLISVVISNNVIEIGEYAFRGCNNLKKITIPNSVTTINRGAFWDCISLKTVILPINISEISECAFYNCQQLSSVTIPNGVTSINKSAFFACRDLSYVFIPNSVTSIGQWAFAHCGSLQKVSVPNTIEKIDREAFPQSVKITSVSHAENDRNSQIIQSSTTSTNESQEWVDLNLPSKTLWAKNNVGAKSSDNIGDFFTWQQSLEIASINGGSVPTKEQFSELLNYCDWEWTSINGNEGYLVSSKRNPKNNIFLPIAGYYSNNGSRRLGSGYYWTKTRYPGNAGDACYFCFFQGYHGDFRVFYLDFRLSVRLVLKSSVTQ